jgi:hypothetical protein
VGRTNHQKPDLPISISAEFAKGIREAGGLRAGERELAFGLAPFL